MWSATRTTVATFGVLAGLSGIEHGVGEVLQGNVAPAAMEFASWPNSEAFAVLNGEPAMSVVPNLLVTGVLAIVASLAFLIWTVRFAQRRHGGLVMVLLSIVMLLVGAGFGPPLLGVLLGAAATRIDAPLSWWRASLPASARQTLGVLWPRAFGGALAAWLTLLVGIPVMSVLLGPTTFVESVLLAAIPSAFGLLLVTVLAGFARDAASQIAASRVVG